MVLGKYKFSRNVRTSENDDLVCAGFSPTRFIRKEFKEFFFYIKNWFEKLSLRGF